MLRSSRMLTSSSATRIVFFSFELAGLLCSRMAIKLRCCLQGPCLFVFLSSNPQDWKPQAKGRSLTFGACNVHNSHVIPHDASHDGKAETVSRWLGREERREDLFEVAGSNSGAV